MELHPAKAISDSEYYEGLDDRCYVRRFITGCHAVVALNDWEGYRFLPVVTSQLNAVSPGGKFCRVPYRYMDSSSRVRWDAFIMDYAMNTIVKPDDLGCNIGYVSDYTMVTKWINRCGRSFGMNAIDLCGHKSGASQD